MRSPSYYFACLVVIGAGWGATQPLTKVAVSEGYRQFGLVFWQMIITGILMVSICVLTRRSIPFNLTTLGTYLVIALIGTILPNAASYQAIVHLPAGLMAILLSLVPMLAFPVAIMLGNETFGWARFAGLFFGLLGVVLIVAPEASLPDRAMLIFIPLAIVAPFFYAFEGNYVARWGTSGLDALQVLAGASIVGAVVALPLALFSGQWIDPRVIWDAPEYAFVASSLIHGLVYAGYVWLVSQAGPVFAAQVSYLVTAFGVFWAMIFLGERYSIWVWLAFGVLMIGLTLVQPRRNSVLAGPQSPGHSDNR